MDSPSGLLGDGAAELARGEAGGGGGGAGEGGGGGGGERVEQEEGAQGGRLPHPSLAPFHTAKDRLGGLFRREDRRENRIADRHALAAPRVVLPIRGLDRAPHDESDVDSRSLHLGPEGRGG